MKRGLVEWDRAELSPAVLEQRVDRAKKFMADNGLDGLVMSTGVAQPVLVRYFTQFLPYWSQAVYLLPAKGDPILLCGLSNRVFGWIRASSTIQTVQASKDLGGSTARAIVERGLKRVGVVDRGSVPMPIFQSIAKAQGVELVEADALRDSLNLGADPDERRLRRAAGRLANEALAAVKQTDGGTEGEFAAQLDRALRLGGAEDVLLLIDSKRGWPGIPGRNPLGQPVRMLVQVEYKGHWIQVGRTLPGPRVPDWFQSLQQAVQPNASVGTVLARARELGDLDVRVYQCRGALPFVALDEDEIVSPGTIVALMALRHGPDADVLAGDTFTVNDRGLESLTR